MYVMSSDLDNADVRMKEQSGLPVGCGEKCCQNERSAELRGDIKELWLLVEGDLKLVNAMGTRFLKETHGGTKNKELYISNIT